MIFQLETGLFLAQTEQYNVEEMSRKELRR